MNEIYTDIENLESFIRVEFINHKMSKETVKEILRITQEIKDKIAKNGTHR